MEREGDRMREEGVRISNELLEVVFLADGSLSGIVDKRSGRRYLTETLFAGLFRVTAPEGDWQGRHADHSPFGDFGRNAPVGGKIRSHGIFAQTGETGRLTAGR